MHDTGNGRWNDPRATPSSAWKRQPSLTPRTSWPDVAPEDGRQCLPPDVPPSPSDGESLPHDDFDDAIASW
ncbi:hypothetical protein COSO111634_34555 [Corallococcus soli]